MPNHDEVLLFANSACQRLAGAVCDGINRRGNGVSCRLGEATVGWQSDREPFVEIGDNVRDRNVVVLASEGWTEFSGVPYSGNDLHMQTLVLLDALWHAAAHICALVMPYMAYGRQERRRGKKTDRTAITARLAARHFTDAAPDLRHIYTIEPHAAAIAGFFQTRFDAIPALHLLVEAVRTEFSRLEIPLRDLLAASPDTGGVARASAFATHCGTEDEPLIIIKRRPAPGLAKVVQVIGNPAGRHVMIVDDVAGSLSTLQAGSEAVMRMGACSVSAALPHGVFVKNQELAPPVDALQILTDSPLARVFIMDTIEPRPEVAAHPKVTIVPSAPLLAEVIHHHFTGDSIRGIGRAA